MKISVITATYNSIKYLPALADSLKAQQDDDFVWVVADGMSTDGTVEYLNSLIGLNLILLCQEDFGIYDALNRAIKIIDSEFYLVVGSDDILYPHAIKVYKEAINNDADIITAIVDLNNGALRPKKIASWYYGQHAFISGHSVGCIIRKTLHDEYGFYVKNFPIAADQYFVLKAVRNGARVLSLNCKVGKYSPLGVSSKDILGSISEWYRIMICLGYNKYLQTILFILRLFKNIYKIKQ